uniref:Uncharacterized protein n=1 Tax=Chromera velia CCMP2878 TaxID=1169474 RepID=A0A0G4G9Z5_9ALVE|eukprot:Cvel_20893.t1-p1 / transcript=Cvel_20893.t1 / gene=Cvel_20893 / organism=Chromera_velia_CCMP2878 / gene_product=hypothetical protein / transcript_product=hypothetical protein / location=Cvel_scaffold1916:4713-7592(+) / protein_length=297 / sequence_SO=supercontig / SO=protein_coding / is_pseudo=false
MLALDQWILLAWVCGVVSVWVLEHPVRRPQTKYVRLARQMSMVRKQCEGVRVSVREFIHSFGFFENFGLVTAIAILVELHLFLTKREYYSGVFWHSVVGYVGANHLLYGLHNMAGTFGLVCQETQSKIKEVAGVGGMLKKEMEGDGCMDKWTVYLWNFSEHRLADVWVHLGMALLHPLRVDHWLCLVLHVMKYSGHPIPQGLSVPVQVGAGTLPLDDVVDVWAHSFSSLRALGVRWFLVSVVLAEAQRWILRREVVSHHGKKGRRDGSPKCQVETAKNADNRQDSPNVQGPESIKGG